jgi:parallel beta-helix repeat protein
MSLVCAAALISAGLSARTGAGAPDDLCGATLLADLSCGIMVRPSSTRISTRNRIVENTLTDNPVGILLFGQPGNTILENTVTGSGTAGILLTGGGATGNVFRENAVSTSAAAVQFGPGCVDNKFIENLFIANTCGLQGTTDGNLFRENVFANNTADACQ